MINPKNIFKHELIGLKTEIIESKNKKLVGEIGKIVDETRNMFIIETNGNKIKVVKEQSTFMFYLPNKNVKIEGSLLIGRPEKRMKKLLPKKRV